MILLDCRMEWRCTRNVSRDGLFVLIFDLFWISINLLSRLQFSVNLSSTVSSVDFLDVNHSNFLSVFYSFLHLNLLMFQILLLLDNVYQVNFLDACRFWSGLGLDFLFFFRVGLWRNMLKVLRAWDRLVPLIPCTALSRRLLLFRNERIILDWTL